MTQAGNTIPTGLAEKVVHLGPALAAEALTRVECHVPSEVRPGDGLVAPLLGTASVSSYASPSFAIEISSDPATGRGEFRLTPLPADSGEPTLVGAPVYDPDRKYRAEIEEEVARSAGFSALFATFAVGDGARSPFALFGIVPESRDRVALPLADDAAMTLTGAIRAAASKQLAQHKEQQAVAAS